jgi:formylglycine-generating enzyme required for sulfatase activity
VSTQKLLAYSTAALFLGLSLVLAQFANAAKPKTPAKKKPAAAAKKVAAKPVVKPAAVKPAGAVKAAPGKLQSFEEKLPDSLVKFSMIAVPGGSFSFADPSKGGASSTVTVKPFYIGKTEVTWDLFDPYAFRPEDASKPVSRDPGGPNGLSRPSKPYGAPDRGFGHQGYAAVSIASHSAEVFCDWLSKKTGKKYRLPTEFEWEYACRAGGPATGPDKSAVLDQAWVQENAGDKTHPVATKKPNAWGIYDMLGNAGEWCVGVDGKPVLRGGTYADPAEKVGPETRAPYSIDWQMQDPQFPKSRWWLSDGPFVGLRVICEP